MNGAPPGGGWQPAATRLGRRVSARRIGALDAVGGQVLTRSVADRRARAGRPSALRLVPARATAARAPAASSQPDRPAGLSDFAYEWMYGDRLPEDAIPFGGGGAVEAIRRQAAERTAPATPDAGASLPPSPGPGSPEREAAHPGTPAPPRTRARVEEVSAFRIARTPAKAAAESAPSAAPPADLAHAPSAGAAGAPPAGGASPAPTPPTMPGPTADPAGASPSQAAPVRVRRSAPAPPPRLPRLHRAHRPVPEPSIVPEESRQKDAHHVHAATRDARPDT